MPRVTKTVAGLDRINVIKTELDTGGAGPFTDPDIPPLSGGDIRTYDADDQAATDQLNAQDRPAVPPIQEILSYFLLNEHKDGGGRDSNCYGRLLDVSRTNIGDLAPMWTDENSTRGAGNTILTKDEKHALQALVETLEIESAGGNVQVAQAAIDNMLIAARDCEVISSAQFNELIGSRDNRQSRGSEIGVGRCVVGDVEHARTL